MIGKILFFVYYFVILFGFLIELPLTWGLTTRRVSLVVALFSIAMKRREFKEVISNINLKRYRLFVFLFFICFCISFFHSLSISTRDDGYTKQFELQFYLYIYLYVFVFSLYCKIVFDSIKSFALIWLPIILIEAGSVFLALSNNTINILFTMMFASDDRFEISAEHGSRIVGLGIMGAPGSIVLSTGVILLVLLRYKQVINLLLFYTLFVYIFVATLFVGRTGVVIEVVTLCFGSLLLGRKRDVFGLVFVGIASLAVLIFIFEGMDSSIAAKFQNWMMGSIDSDSRNHTIDGIVGTGIPLLNGFDMIFGSGIMRGNDGHGGFYDLDSGLIMTLIANGIVGFVCYYYALLNLLLLPKLKITSKERYFFLLLISISFIIEFKEPFFLKYFYAWFILAVMFLWQDGKCLTSYGRKLKK